MGGLYHGCRTLCTIGERFHLRSTSVVLGSEGLEPSPTWLRARNAAANTSIPFSNQNDRKSQTLSCQEPVVGSRRDGIRTRASRLIRTPLLPLSYTLNLTGIDQLLVACPQTGVGPEGLEPSPCGLKDRCAAITPQPQM